jgi:RNA polymerase sigma-70 factor (ECF subfamily)
MTGDEAPERRRDASEEKPHETPASSGLIRRARGGDRSALDVLFERVFPWLRRRARGRLPAWARGLVDTGDLVQDVLLNVFRRITRLESTSSAAFRAYLRRAVDRRIQDEMRWVGRRGTWGGLEEKDVPPSTGPSPLQQLVDREDWDRYLDALERLTPRERRLIVGRAELGYSFKQLALIDDRASADAARKALRRALVRLSAEMER